MSTRQTLYLPTNWLHIFRDVVTPGIYIDIGRTSYNRAWRIWPFDLKRLY